MKPKHTPGPWFIDETDDTYFIGGEGADELAAQIEKYPLGSKKTYEANARLIAAAPDMLKLLTEIGLMLKGGNSIIPTRDPVVLAKIQDLVRKAVEGAE